MKIGPTLPGGPAPEPRSVTDASKQFEGLLMSELFKVMRRSIPKSVMSSGLSNDVFTSMLDEQLARNIADGGGLGLGAMIAHQFGETNSRVPEEVAARLGDGTWVRPIPREKLHFKPAQQFGAARGSRGHRGLDFGARTGTPVVASGAGTVAAINRDPNTTGGLSVAIAHPGGLSTSYAHLDSVADLKVGAAVNAGQRIGAVGATGSGAKGSHLHFAVRAEINGHSVHVDPEPHVGSWPTADDKP